MLGSKKKKKLKEKQAEEQKILEMEEKISLEEETKDQVTSVDVDSVSENEEDKEITEADAQALIGFLKPSHYGVLLPFIEDINVTDINWNGRQLWIDDLTKGRYLSDIVLTNEFIESFATRVSNVVSKQFNKYIPKLEAETESLRISILHNSVAHTGTSISIRKTPAIKRINFLESIRNGTYCSEEVANLMSNSVKAKLNIVVCGLPGCGKTELVKYLTNYIFPHDRAITIEDSLEIHYSEINPGKDCVELKVDDSTFTYVDAIKAALRQLPQWILLSEARSVEVKYLIEALSTGAKCLTTIHTDDVRKLPDRIKNMIGDTVAADRIENEVYSFIDVAILVNKRIDSETGAIVRYIDQIATFTRTDGFNECRLILNEGNRTSEQLQDSLWHKYNLMGIENPFNYTFIK